MGRFASSQLGRRQGAGARGQGTIGGCSRGDHAGVFVAYRAALSDSGPRAYRQEPNAQRRQHKPFGIATLDGGFNRSVLTINDNITAITNLTIAHGVDFASDGGHGGGILNSGRLTLIGSSFVQVSSTTAVCAENRLLLDHLPHHRRSAATPP